MRFIIALCLCCITLSVFSQREAQASIQFPNTLFFKVDADGTAQPRKIMSAAMRAENPRIVAIALNITLGMFGMHRLYLGTDVKVPIIYTVTLGGGLVLWVADLVLLISAKDITPFMDNPNFFMWNDTK